MGWIETKNRMPEHNAKVWYFFDKLGVFTGRFTIEKHDDGDYECFSGSSGFLCGGEVTHWMPYQENMNKPKTPVIKEKQ